MAGILLGVNATLISSHPQGFWTSGLTVVAYVLGLLAVVCLVGAMRRWPMPLTGHRRVVSDQVRQTVNRIVGDWRNGTLRTIDFATDPDISDVVIASKRHRKFMGDRQPELIASNPGIKTRAYVLIDDCVQAFRDFESVMNPIDLHWKNNNKSLQAMYDEDPGWKAQADAALKELQSRVNAAIEALNELHGDALIDPVALSNGSDHGPPR